MGQIEKIVFVLFFLSLIINAIASLAPIKWWDETVYANFGYWLQNHPLDYSFHGWGDRVFSWVGKAGFRPPLISYLIATVDFITGLNQFFVNPLMPLIGALGVVFLFYLAKKLFNEKIAIYSALLMIFIPVYVFLSGKLLNDILVTTLTVLTFLSFWLGFEEQNKKFQLLTGFFLGLSVLAKYTALIIVPTLFIFLLLKNRNFHFIFEKKILVSSLIFLITLSPLFIYSYFTYGNVLGAFIHGSEGAFYWGGVQPWYFIFSQSIEMFSATIAIFLIGMYVIIKNFKIKNSNILFLLTWFVVFAIAFSTIPHKETRFFLPLVPAFCIISVIGVDSFKKNQKIILSVILIIVIGSTAYGLYSNYRNEDSKPVYCFLQSTNFVKQTENNAVIFTDNSPIVYYYAHRESPFYSNNQGIMNVSLLASTLYKGKPVYVFWSRYGSPNDIRQMLRNSTDFTISYSCPEDGSLAIIYKFNK